MRSRQLRHLPSVHLCCYSCEGQSGFECSYCQSSTMAKTAVATVHTAAFAVWFLAVLAEGLLLTATMKYMYTCTDVWCCGPSSWLCPAGCAVLTGLRATGVGRGHHSCA